jgi:carbohydrate kinase (thermoresistant glucokinase family)
MPVLVVMGVSGCGKSSVGAALAKRLGDGWVFADADAYHPQANIDKMANGQPLNDEDREPWLKKLAECIDEWNAQGKGAVLACSALKRKYRSMLLGPNEKNRDAVVFVHLNGHSELIAERMANREGHFMKQQMLLSQLATLEPLQEDERGVTIDDLSAAPDKLAADILRRVGELSSP